MIPHDPPAFPGRWLMGRSLSWLLLLMVWVTAVGCSLQSEVIHEDESAKRRVELISGAEPPAEPPAPGFGEITGRQVDASLRRITVEPAKWATFIRDKPTHMFDQEQRDWIVEYLAPRLPDLKPDQRLRFVFRDRFKHNLVELELYPQGEKLVYRFTQLSAANEDLELNRGRKVRNWVTLVTLPGQSLEEDLWAFTLTDPVISDNSELAARRSENLELLRVAMELNKIDRDEIKRLGTLVEKRPDFAPETLRTYLKKRDTLQKAFDQEIFDQAEFDKRREALLADLEH